MNQSFQELVLLLCEVQFLELAVPLHGLLLSLSLLLGKDRPSLVIVFINLGVG